ncbi:MAG: hypothetical protein KF687_08235 [Cyclobacteriaceae bacterium]|nr:hypothetical protein [Cyclobacteriaceae bacterium]
MNKGKMIMKWVVLGVAFIALLGWITQLLWNWLVPELFSGPLINYWQSLGLLLLSKILFSGLGGRHRHSGKAYWKHRYDQKLSTMSPEAQAAFKEKMMTRWCRKPADSNANG